jgi:transcriptional regulator with XRE-family HTH domain
MSRVIHFAQESSVGPWARRMRMSLRMTKQELANMCGVSRDEVDLFEHNLPVGLDTEDRLLKKLQSARTALCQTFPR